MKFHWFCSIFFATFYLLRINLCIEFLFLFIIVSFPYLSSLQLQTYSTLLGSPFIFPISLNIISLFFFIVSFRSYYLLFPRVLFHYFDFLFSRSINLISYVTNAPIYYYFILFIYLFFLKYPVLAAAPDNLPLLTSIFSSGTLYIPSYLFITYFLFLFNKYTISHMSFYKHSLYYLCTPTLLAIMPVYYFYALYEWFFWTLPLSPLL